MILSQFSPPHLLTSSFYKTYLGIIHFVVDCSGSHLIFLQSSVYRRLFSPRIKKPERESDHLDLVPRLTMYGSLPACIRGMVLRNICIYHPLGLPSGRSRCSSSSKILYLFLVYAIRVKFLNSGALWLTTTVE
jgi:hypothetical protein